MKNQSPEGILYIDKPSGMTSHDVVDTVRRKTGVRRVGHAGTLDPLATGLLIVLVGRNYTKRQAEFLKLNKEYEVTAQLGIVTDSYDSDGKIVKNFSWSQVSKISRPAVAGALPKFTGTIQQQVPAFSAVKLRGRKLYEAARQGHLIAEQLPIRQVQISELNVLDFVTDAEEQTVHIRLKVACSSGTYIRSLVHDLGQELGVGATVIALRRTAIDKHRVEDAFPLDVVKIADLIK